VHSFARITRHEPCTGSMKCGGSMYRSRSS